MFDSLLFCYLVTVFIASSLMRHFFHGQIDMPLNVECAHDGAS